MEFHTYRKSWEKHCVPENGHQRLEEAIDLEERATMRVNLTVLKVQFVIKFV